MKKTFVLSMLVLAAICYQALAYSISYELSEDESYYTAYGEPRVFDLSTPAVQETYKGKKVTHVDGFNNVIGTDLGNCNLFPQSVTTIDDDSFKGCSATDSMTFPGNIKLVDEDCFIDDYWGSPALDHAIFNDVTNLTIGRNSFTDCPLAADKGEGLTINGYIPTGTLLSEYDVVWTIKPAECVKSYSADKTTVYIKPSNVKITIKFELKKKQYTPTHSKDITVTPASASYGETVTVEYTGNLKYNKNLYDFTWSSNPTIAGGFTPVENYPWKATFVMPAGGVQSIACTPSIRKDLTLELTGANSINNVKEDNTATYVLNAYVPGSATAYPITDGVITASSEDYVDINGYVVRNQNITRQQQTVNLTGSWSECTAVSTLQNVSLAAMPINAIGLKKGWNLLGLLVQPKDKEAFAKEISALTDVEKSAYIFVDELNAGTAIWVFGIKRTVVYFDAAEDAPLPPVVEPKEGTWKMMMVLTGEEEWLDNAVALWKWNGTSFETTEKEEVKIGEAYWVFF